MLRLTLVRHAKTEPSRPGLEDWERVLEPRGHRDAPQMGQRLKERRLRPDRIVTSPAVRAVTTAEIFARELGLSANVIEQEERLYLAAPKDILLVVRELGGPAKHVMLVGHNPGLSEFADRIGHERPVDNLPTCAVYTLQFRLTDWAHVDWSTGINADLDYPGNIA